MANEKVLALVVLIVAVMGIGAYLVVNLPTSNAQTIEVGGSSEVTSMPDFVSVYINIETMNESAQLAKDANSVISEKVMTELRGLGFSDDEIQTISWNVYEDYSWNEDERSLNGYRVSNLIKVEMEEYSFVGTVVDKVIDAGALVQSINFELTEEREDELKAQALEEATAEAMDKAEAIASGSGKKVGKILSVSTDDYRYYPYPLYEAASGVDAKTVTTQISPRQLTVYGNVRVVFQLK